MSQREGRGRAWAVVVASAFLLLPLLTRAAAAQTGGAGPPAPPEAGVQSWNEAQLTVPLAARVDLQLGGGVRLGRDRGRLIDERGSVGLAVRTGDHLTWYSSYSYVAAQPAAQPRGSEHRLSFAGTVNVTWRGFAFSDRNLLERRLLRARADTTRYRNRLQVDHAVGPREWRTRLFAADEIFYDSGSGAWTRNRFTVGASREFNRHFSGDVYYLRQNDGFSRPGDLNVIGTMFRLRL